MIEEPEASKWRDYLHRHEGAFEKNWHSILTKFLTGPEECISVTSEKSAVAITLSKGRGKEASSYCVHPNSTGIYPDWARDMVQMTECLASIWETWGQSPRLHKAGHDGTQDVENWDKRKVTLCLKIIEKQKKMRFIIFKNIRREKEIIDMQTGKKVYSYLLVA